MFMKRSSHFPIALLVLLSVVVALAMVGTQVYAQQYGSQVTNGPSRPSRPIARGGYWRKASPKGTGNGSTGTYSPAHAGHAETPTTAPTKGEGYGTTTPTMPPAAEDTTMPPSPSGSRPYDSMQSATPSHNLKCTPDKEGTFDCAFSSHAM